MCFIPFDKVKEKKMRVWKKMGKIELMCNFSINGNSVVYKEPFFQNREIRKEGEHHWGESGGGSPDTPYLNTDHSLSLFHWCWQKAWDYWVSDHGTPIILASPAMTSHWRGMCERRVPLTQRAESQLRNTECREHSRGSHRLSENFLLQTQLWGWPGERMVESHILGTPSIWVSGGCHNKWS